MPAIAGGVGQAEALIRFQTCAQGDTQDTHLQAEAPFSCHQLQHDQCKVDTNSNQVEVPEPALWHRDCRERPQLCSGPALPELAAACGQQYCMPAGRGWAVSPAAAQLDRQDTVCHRDCRSSQQHKQRDWISHPGGEDLGGSPHLKLEAPLTGRRASMAAPVASDQYSQIAGPASSTACLKAAIAFDLQSRVSFSSCRPSGSTAAPIFQSAHLKATGQAAWAEYPLIEPPGSV